VRVVSRLITLPDFGRGNLWDGVSGRIASPIGDRLVISEGGSATGLAAVGIGSAGIFDSNAGTPVRILK